MRMDARRRVARYRRAIDGCEVKPPLVDHAFDRLHVAAVTVEDQHAPDPVPDEALDGVEQHRKPASRLCRHGAGEVHVMLGDAYGQRHDHRDLRVQGLCGPLGDVRARSDVLL